LILTFETLLQRGAFVPLMKTVLTRLAQEYQRPVDIEFAVSFNPGSDKPELVFHLCNVVRKNQWSADGSETRSIPTDLAPRIQFCSAHGWCLRGV